MTRLRATVATAFAFTLVLAPMTDVSSNAAEPTPLAPEKVLDICLAPSFADAIVAAEKLDWDRMGARQLAPYRLGLLINIAGNAQDEVPTGSQASDIVKAVGWRSTAALGESELVLVQAEYGVAAGLSCYLIESAKRADLEPAIVARLGAHPMFQGKAGNATAIFWNGAGVAAVLLSYGGAEGDTSYLSVSRRGSGK